MSLEAVWGFDPEEILKTRKAFHNTEEKSAIPEEESAPDQEVKGVRMPSGLGAQVYEPRRLFHS